MPESIADLEVRVAEMARLRQVAGSEPIPRFVAALRDGSFPVAKTATMGLCDRGALLGPLEELLTDEDPNLRWRACSLGWFFNVKGFEPALVGALKKDADPMVRMQAAWALRWASTDRAAKALIAATRDPDRMVAHCAGWVLTRVLAVRHPHLPSLKQARRTIPAPTPEPPRPAGRPEDIDDDARAFAAFASDTPGPAARAPLAAEAPSLDGRRDAAYSRAAGGSLVHIDGYPDAPLRPTDFRAVCTREALHVHVHCRIAGPDDLTAKCDTDGGPVHADNSVEIFLDPSGRGRRPYYQVCVNAKNARTVARVGAVGHTWKPAGATGRQKPWHPAGVRTTVTVEKDAYHVEVVVPFADLGLRPGRINKLWRINVVRNAHLPTGDETTSWADMGDVDAHQPEKFGWLWLDVGRVVNADATALSCEPIPLEAGLPAFKVVAGRPEVADGEVRIPAGHARLLLRKPIDHAAFEIAAEGQLRHQLRFMFAGDAANRTVGWMAAYINLINEINVAYLSGWEHWAPPQPGHLGIFTEVYPRLTHSRWYRLAVRVRTERVQMLIDDAVHLECPNPAPDARWFGLGFVAGGRLRKLRVRPLE